MRTITLEEIEKYLAENADDESAHLKSPTAYCDDVIDYFYGDGEARIGTNLPWQKAHGKMQMRGGEVTLWLGMNGHGKSLVLSQVMLNAMSQGDKVAIASLEMRPVSTLARMVRQAAASAEPSIDYIKKFHNWTDGRLWIYDQHGTVPPDRIINLVKYCSGNGINHVVIDSLMKVVEAEDDYNGQKKLIDRLCVMARDTGIAIHVVHHSRKLGDESKPPGKMDAKGSGAITDLVDNCITVWRRKEEGDGPDCLLIIDKQRHGEWEGKVGLFYNKDAMAYSEDERRRIKWIDL